MSDRKKMTRGFGFRGPEGLRLRGVGDLDPAFFGQAYPWLVRSGPKDPESVHAWTYRAVKLIGQTVGATPLRVQMGKSGEPVPTTDPLQVLLDRPNKHYSSSVFWRLWERLVQLKGRACIVLDPDDVAYLRGRVPKSMYVMDLDRFMVTVKLDSGITTILGPGQWSSVREVQGITHIETGQRYSAHQVIIYESPEGAPLTAARQSVDADYSAATYSKSWVQNDLNPSGWFSVEDWLTDEEYKQFQAHKRAENAGAAKAGKDMLLEGGVTWTPNPQTMRDMQWIEGRAHWLEEICAAFGVPKTLLGVTDDLNYATHLGQQRVFWECTILPEMSDIQDMLWTGLFSAIGGGAYWAVFDTSRVAALATDYQDRVTRAQALFAMGVPLNVLNKRFELGLPRIIGGDVGLVGAGLLPLSDAVMTTDQLFPSMPAVAAQPDPTANAAGVEATAPDTVQDTAMNGGQVAALQGIIQAVSDKTLPAAAAVLMIQAAFPAIPSATVQAMVGAAAVFEAAPEAPVEPQASQHPDPAGDMVQAAIEEQTPRERLLAAIALRRDLERLRADVAEMERGAAQKKWSLFYNRVVAPSERAYARKFSAILFRQRADVLKQFDEQVKRSAAPVNVRAPEDSVNPSAIKLDVSYWSAEMDRLLRGTYEDVIKKALAASANGSLPVISAADPRMTAIIDDRIGDKLVGVTNETIDEVRATLNSGLETGKTIADMRRDLSQMPGFSRERARTVAVTEMGHANNNARAEQFAEYEVDEIIWSSVGDGQVRPTHLAAEKAGKRTRGQPFPNGLRWPHDPTGSAAEVINCRCGMLASYE